MKKLKIGLALGGGGARGLAHIGILRGLENSGFKPNLIAGTSVGAIIGSMYAATMDSNWVENRIKNFIQSDEFKSIGLNKLNPTLYTGAEIINNQCFYIGLHPIEITNKVCTTLVDNLLSFHFDKNI